MILRATLLALLSLVPLATLAPARRPGAVAGEGGTAGTSQSGLPTIDTLELSEELVSQGRIGGIAVDRRGFVYVTNFREALWRIAPDGAVEPVSLALQGPSGIAIDDDGNVLVANFFSHTISKITPGGEVSTLVGRGPVAPVGLAFDAAGNLFMCNCGNDTVGKMAIDGTVGTFASGELFACPNGLTFDDRGDLYVVNFNNDHVVRISPSGEASILATLPRHPGAAAAGGDAARSGGNAHIAFAQGALFVTRIRANDIYRVGLDGEATRFAGTGKLGLDDGPALSATLARPNGIAVGPNGATLWFNNLEGQWRGEVPTSIVVRKLLLPARSRGGTSPLNVGGQQRFTRRSIRVGELTFDALIAGPEDGDPVVLLHGFPETSYAFRHQLEALGAAGFRAVAPDQRGYSRGARPEAVTDYAMGNLVGDVVGIANALGFESFHLVGHDWGGAVAWVFAATFPQRVRTLTVLSTPHVRAFGRALADPDDDQSERSAYFDTFSAEDAEQRFLADDAALLRDILEGTGREAADVYLEALGTPAALRGALNWYRASAVRSPATGRAAAPASATPAPLLITVPTLYIWGSADRAFGRRAALATEEFVEGPYRFEVFQGSGHWLMEQDVERVNDLLIDHLTGG